MYINIKILNLCFQLECEVKLAYSQGVRRIMKRITVVKKNMQKIRIVLANVLSSVIQHLHCIL